MFRQSKSSRKAYKSSETQKIVETEESESVNAAGVEVSDIFDRNDGFDVFDSNEDHYHDPDEVMTVGNQTQRNEIGRGDHRFMDSSTRTALGDDLDTFHCKDVGEYSPYSNRLRSHQHNLDGEESKLNDEVMKKYESSELSNITSTELRHLHDFRIIDDIQQLFWKCGSYEQPKNANMPINIQRPQLTVGELAADLEACFNSNGIRSSARNEIMEILHNYFPECNLPVDKDEINGDFIKAETEKYVIPDVRTLWYDICSNGCTAFVGTNLNLDKCPLCKANRYRNCTERSCVGLTYEQCGHRSNRKPFKRIAYRPILGFILQALHTNGFLKALEYINDDVIHSPNGVYHDVASGRQYRKHIKEMDDHYAKSMNAVNTNNRPKKVNILLGEFYDGCQIFQSRATSFWPLLVHILNLPPPYRQKIGIGLFCLSIFTGKTNCGAEDFLLKHCLCDELKTLENGVALRVGKREYFIQVRMISTVLDTIAVQDVLKVKSSNSYIGCFFCNTGEGYRLSCNTEQKLGAKMVYHNNRKHLPMRSFLRSAGNCGCCCPSGYYRDGIEISNHPEYSLKGKLPPQKEFQIPNRYPFAKFCNDTCIGRDPSVSIEIKRDLFEYIMQGEGRWDVYHPILEKTEDFVEDLHYHFCDYTAQVELKHTSHLSYIRNAQRAKTTGKPSNGVKGFFHLSALSYVDIETQCAWEYMHIFSNIFRNISDLWMDNLDINTQELEFYKVAGIHNYLWDEPSRHPWAIPKFVQYQVSIGWF